MCSVEITLPENALACLPRSSSCPYTYPLIKGQVWMGGWVLLAGFFVRKERGEEQSRIGMNVGSIDINLLYSSSSSCGTVQAVHLLS